MVQSHKSIFSDTHSNLEIASNADVLSHENSETDSDEEQTETSHGSYPEEDGEEDLTSTSESWTEGVKRTVSNNSLDIKPLGRKKGVLGESQQTCWEKMMEAQKERHAEFLAFEKEKAELKRLQKWSLKSSWNIQILHPKEHSSISDNKQCLPSITTQCLIAIHLKLIKWQVVAKIATF